MLSAHARRTVPALTTVLALALGGAAHASTASVSGGVLTVQAGKGETNTITLKRLDDQLGMQVISVKDSDGTTPPDSPLGAPDPVLLLGGPGCLPGEDEHEVICRSQTFTEASIFLLDGNDYFAPADGTGALPPATVNGSGGNDFMRGTEGDDKLQGGSGNDQLFGAGGDDGLAPSVGNDDLNGGDGLDRAYYGERMDDLTLTLDDAANDGGAGESDFIRSDVETVSGGGGNDLIVGNDGDNRIYGGYGNDTIEAGGGADVVFGDIGDDTIRGGDGDDSIFGRAGDDDVDAGDGNDYVNGDEGDNVLRGGSGDDRLYAWDGNDLLHGGPGADRMDGHNGIDTVTYEDKTASVWAQAGRPSGTGCGSVASGCENDAIFRVENLTGGSGDDTLIGDEWANTLRGGDGADVLLGKGRGDVYRGGDGTDEITYADAKKSVTVTAADGQANDGVADEGDDVGADVERIIGSVHDDSLTGSGADNDLRGGEGDDVLDGAAGADRIEGGAGEDSTSYAGRGSGVTVTLDGVANDGAAGEGDNLIAGLEDVTGTDHADSLTGSDGAEKLSGGGGDDTLDGLRGADHLVGGSGTDTAVYSGRTALESVRVTLDDRDDDGGVGEGDNVARDVENLTGGDEADDFRGSADANVLVGGGGNDKLAGLQGNDVLRGGDGNDAIDGGEGNDLLVPGFGADDVLGGANTDRADYSDHPAPVTVTFDNLPNDGNPGEGDNVHDNVESVIYP